ncbi:MAG: oligosaccharide flippase family protein [Deltaproteobacteria bacterium]|nr:oligosaccharide flippase family protein [Deltaproteobacteria bacterium]
MKLVHRIKALNKIEFVRHGKNYLAGNFMVQGLTFLSIPVFTRLLNPDDYGTIAVFTSIVAVFSILLGLNFNGSVTRKYYENDSTFGEFIYSITRFIGVFAFSASLLSLIFSTLLASFFEIPILVFIMAIGVSFFSVFVNMYLSYLQASMQSKRYATISFIQALLILTISICLILWLNEKRYLGKIIAQLLVISVLAIYSLLLLRKLEKPLWDKSHIKYSLKFGVPLIPHTLSHFVLSSFDRIVINQLTNATQTGLYSLAYNVGSILMIIVSGLNNAWVPILFRNLNEAKYNDIQKKSDLYTIVIVYIAFVLALFSREAVMIMASTKYYAALTIIPVIILSTVFIFLYQLCVNYTFYLKKNIWISINTFICGGLNLAMNYVFIPKYGYQAAAWTTLMSYIALFVLNYITARQLMKEKLMNFRFKLFFLALIIAVYFLSHIISLNLHFYLLQLLNKFVFMVITGLGIFFMFKRRFNLHF